MAQSAVLLLLILFTPSPNMPMVFVDFSETGVAFWHPTRERCITASQDLHAHVMGGDVLQDVPDKTALEAVCIEVPLKGLRMIQGEGT